MKMVGTFGLDRCFDFLQETLNCFWQCRHWKFQINLLPWVKSEHNIFFKIWNISLEFLSSIMIKTIFLTIFFDLNFWQLPDEQIHRLDTCDSRLFLLDYQTQSASPTDKKKNSLFFRSVASPYDLYTRGHFSEKKSALVYIANFF